MCYLNLFTKFLLHIHLHLESLSYLHVSGKHRIQSMKSPGNNNDKFKYLINFKLLLSNLFLGPNTVFLAAMTITALGFYVICTKKCINVLPNEEIINHAILLDILRSYLVVCCQSMFLAVGFSQVYISVTRNTNNYNSD